MGSTFVISLIAGIIVISLVASGISYSRQQAMKRRKAQIAKLRAQADEALTYISLLLKIDEQYGLIIQLQSIAVASLTRAFQLAPDDPLITNNLKIQKERLDVYKAGTRQNKVMCYMINDGELAQAQSQLGQVAKLLDIFRNKGLLSSASCSEYQLHIQTLKVELNINSNLYQADSFAEEGDITMYTMHLKQAIEQLKKSNIDNKVKNQRIRELTELLNEVKRTNRVIEGQSLIKPQEKKTTRPKSQKPKVEENPPQENSTSMSTEEKKAAAKNDKEKW